MRNCKELCCVLGGVFLMVFALGGATRERADRIRCAANLRQLYRVIQIYEEDQGGIPPVNIPQKPLWKFWSDCLKPYVQDRLIFACPADPRSAYLFEEQSPLFSPRRQSHASYGMNWFLNARSARKKGAPEPKLRFLRNPARIVLFADSKGPYLMPERFWTYEKDFRHGGGLANFAFADGHVELRNQRFFGTYGHDGVFKTDFSKWHWQ